MVRFYTRNFLFISVGIIYAQSLFAVTQRPNPSPGFIPNKGQLADISSNPALRFSYYIIGELFGYFSGNSHGNVSNGRVSSGIASGFLLLVVETQGPRNYSTKIR